jgi:hypothetical protein
VNSILRLLPLTVRHGFVIQEVDGVRRLDAAGWDVLRGSETSFGFRTAESQRDRVRPRAVRIAEIANECGARRLCSYGVGTGLVERHLLEFGLDLTVTEYAPGTVAKLRELFPLVVEHDLRAGSLKGFDLHLLHRVDTELSDSEWRRYFASTDEPQLVVMTEFLTWRTLKHELKLRRRRDVIAAGWLRTERRMRSLLPRSSEQLQVFDLPGFLVTPR